MGEMTNTISGYTAKTAYEGYAKTTSVSVAKSEQGQTQQTVTTTAVLTEETAVVFEGGQNDTLKTYSPDMVSVNQLKKLTEHNAKLFLDLLDKLIGTQGFMASGRFAMSMEAWGKLQSGSERYANVGFSLNIEFSFSFSFSGTIDEGVRAEAAALIADDGPLGFRQVSENILNFAKAISGGDPAKVDMLWTAALKCFNQVAAMFGGLENMPEVSQKTYQAINDGFRAWKEESGVIEESNITEESSVIEETE